MTDYEKKIILDEVIQYLRLDDPVDDSDIKKLSTFIDDGEDYINEYTGTVNIYSHGAAKRLLKDYVRYAYNYATEYFGINYKSELGRLQWKEAVKDFKNQKANNEESGI